MTNIAASVDVMEMRDSRAINVQSLHISTSAAPSDRVSRHLPLPIDAFPNQLLIEIEIPARFALLRNARRPGTPTLGFLIYQQDA
jgi:hypothetical protein